MVDPNILIYPDLSVEERSIMEQMGDGEVSKTGSVLSKGPMWLMNEVELVIGR